MEFNSSQPKNNDSTSMERKRSSDSPNILEEQRAALAPLMGIEVRRFRRENVSIPSISGETIIKSIWATDCEPSAPLPTAASETFKCETCGKEFDKRQKLLLHSRFHKKQEQT